MKLAVFFTYGVSLKVWCDSGLIQREKLIYQEHLRRQVLDEVYWFTYGVDDGRYERMLKEKKQIPRNIGVIPMPGIFNFPLGKLLYSFLLPLIQRKVLKKVNGFKTNQFNGSWAAVLARWLYGKPLIVRGGFVLSYFIERQTRFRLKVRWYNLIEKIACCYCDALEISTHFGKGYLMKKHRIPADKITVLPNYIDTGLFYPGGEEKYHDRLIFVGRLSYQKNLYNLIDAISRSGLGLDIYGRGELENDLKTYVEEKKADVSFKGIIPNNALPDILRRYRHFILPSCYEGMPKTLLEGMACGLICIATDTAGINEIIEDGKDGYLIRGIASQDILFVLKKMQEMDSRDVPVRAVEKISKEYSLQKVADIEKSVFGCLQ